MVFSDLANTYIDGMFKHIQINATYLFTTNKLFIKVFCNKSKIQHDNVTYVQKGHWESRFLLLICIFQQYRYKLKSTFYKYLNTNTLHSCQHAWGTLL